MTTSPPSFDAPTEADINERLNDLLARWHAWSNSYSFGKGYPSTDPMFRVSQTPTHWDSRNGALDVAVDNKIMEAFDAELWQVPRPHVIALQFQARNFACRAQVWRSPYLPTDDEERRVLLMEARNMLLRRLAKAGVMS